MLNKIFYNWQVWWNTYGGHIIDIDPDSFTTQQKTFIKMLFVKLTSAENSNEASYKSTDGTSGWVQILGLNLALRQFVPFCKVFSEQISWVEGSREEEVASPIWRVCNICGTSAALHSTIAIPTNTFCNFDKYIWQFGQIQFAMWKNTIRRVQHVSALQAAMQH